MTVQELIEQLEQYDEDTEVLIVTQPAWPLRFNVSHIVASSELGTDEDDDESFDAFHRRCDGFRWGSDRCEYCEEDRPDEPDPDEKPEIVYIVEGGHPYDNPYGPREAFNI